MDYNKLSKDNRWLGWAGGSDNPDSIGGRDTDFEQVGYSLTGIVKSIYPVNEVPETIARSITEMQAALDRASELVKQVIELVSDDIESKHGVKE
jgi:hypothetical protein